MRGKVWGASRGPTVEAGTTGGGTPRRGGASRDTSGAGSIGGGTGGPRPDTDTTDTRSLLTGHPQV